MLYLLLYFNEVVKGQIEHDENRPDRYLIMRNSVKFVFIIYNINTVWLSSDPRLMYRI